MGRKSFYLHVDSNLTLTLMSFVALNVQIAAYQGLMDGLLVHFDKVCLRTLSAPRSGALLVRSVPCRTHFLQQCAMTSLFHRRCPPYYCIGKSATR